MHLTLCDDLGPQGAQNEDMQLLSGYCAEQVDFAKHGKPVSPEDIAPFDKKKNDLGKRPDFLEREDDDAEGALYESKTANGLIYRQIDLK